MNVRLIGDIHLGKRFPFTTAKSALAFKKLHEGVLDTCLEGASMPIQLGDLFDSFSVSGETLVAGYRFAKHAEILAGNHDKSNNTDKSSALELLWSSLDCDVVWNEPTVTKQGGTTFHLVPHQLTQELFEQGLAALEPASGLNVLCLHCNFGNREGNLIENYLRPEVAKDLLTKFHLIVSGHEHNFSTPMKGLVMLGSVLPFNFGEMDDKFIMDYDTETGAYELIKTWSSRNYAQLPPTGLASPAPFIEFVGTVDVEEAATLNKTIAGLYASDHVIAVKNSTKLVRHEREAESHKAEDWLEVVLKQCSETQQDLLNAAIGELE